MSARRNVDYYFRVGRDDISGTFRNLEREEERFHRSSSRNWRRHEAEGKRSFRGIETAAVDLTNSLVGIFSMAALGASLRQMITDLAAFEDGLSGVSIKSGEALESLGGIRKELLVFAQMKGIRATPEELTQAMNLFAGAGMTANDSLIATKETAKATAISLSDLQTGAKGVIAVMGGFNKPASELNKTLSQMLFAADQGVIDFPDFANAMVKVAAPAKQLGATAEEVFSILSLLTKSGVANVDEAGTAVSRMMMRFADPKFKKDMKKLGIEVFDKNNNRKSMADILELISKKYNALKNDVQRGKFLKVVSNDMFETRGIVLLLDHIEALNKQIEDTRQVAGKMDEDFSKAAERLSATLGQMKAMAKDAGIAFAESFVPTIERISEFINEMAPPEEGGIGGKIRKRTEQEKDLSLGERLIERSSISFLAKVAAALTHDRTSTPGIPERLNFSTQRTPPPDRSYLPIYLQPKIEIKAQIEGPTGKIRTDVKVNDPSEWERRIPLQP